MKRDLLRGRRALCKLRMAPCFPQGAFFCRPTAHRGLKIRLLPVGGKPPVYLLLELYGFFVHLLKFRRKNYSSERHRRWKGGDAKLIY